MKADGWVLTGINGSHHHFTHPTKPGLVTVPHPKKDLPIGTVKASGNKREFNPACP
ncbi:type II toxin-antitoxin system HicA family toxin [Pantoea agglomerans]|uniref:type II toxin-antitoxin system HicA family toxin n=1 Tax=Enterobacter agglomerans TaxID=549 RepID=UPI003C7B9664